jgi:hypothetical protein
MIVILIKSNKNEKFAEVTKVTNIYNYKYF